MKGQHHKARIYTFTKDNTIKAELPVDDTGIPNHLTYSIEDQYCVVLLFEHRDKYAFGLQENLFPA